jgi:glutathione synthase/RimK-type ligase-like ATP-grasp enzyme
MLYIYPYRYRSRSARRLARLLDAVVLKTEQRQPVSYDSTIINWGSSKCPYDRRILNPPEAIELAANKRNAFLALQSKGVSIPRFVTDAMSVTWHGSSPTVIRHKLTGHSGEGIEIVEPGVEPKDFPDARLYVEYLKKNKEYRIHVIGDAVVAIQRKARRHDTPDDEVDWKVRNHKNGFVFARQDVNVSEDCLSAARDAVKALGLSFGAVDIIVSTRDKKPYVLEVNTAPGLEGQTINDYAEGFKKFINLG